MFVIKSCFIVFVLAPLIFIASVLAGPYVFLVCVVGFHEECDLLNQAVGYELKERLKKFLGKCST